MKILCDTNALSALRLGNSGVVEIFEAADEILLSVVVLGELLSGYKCGSKLKENLLFLERLQELPGVSILPVTRETAEAYSDLYQFLKKSGKPIPVNDLWIAAQAVEIGAILLTDDKHFDAIPSLRKRGLE